MEVTLSNVERALTLAHEQKWGGKMPIVRAKVRVVINSLCAQNPRAFNKDAAPVLFKLIKKKQNSKIRKILIETPVEAFAFAIYDALN